MKKEKTYAAPSLWGYSSRRDKSSETIDRVVATSAADALTLFAARKRLTPASFNEIYVVTSLSVDPETAVD